VPLGKDVAITLDTVFRLAELHNARIALAREKLVASESTCGRTLGCWLPHTYAGIGYYRHEGGIQNEDGTLTHSSFGALFPGLQLCSEWDIREATYRQVDAQRQKWQNKAELTKVNTEVLQDAATTYIDLLTARRGEAVAAELEKLERSLLQHAEKVAREQKGATIQVESVRTALSSAEHTAARLREQGNAAAAKLAYLLGLPPDANLIPVDALLAPIELVDASPPTEDLVARALTQGPGVRELEGLLATVQGGIDRMSGPRALLPTLQVNVGEGAFGAGPGGRMDFDNRLDVWLQARWDLTRLLSAQQERQQAHSQLRQVQLNYEDLRGKLTAGVREARGGILGGREQIGLAVEQLKHANETYRLSDRRLREKVEGSSVNEVLQTIRGLEQAHLNHITSISSHNKAQVRLLLLLGAPNEAPKGH
jgi:outer membrane protein TolC